MHRTVIGWVIYGGRHCRRVKNLLAQSGNRTQVAGLYHVAVKAGFYRKAVEVYYIYLDPVTFTHISLKAKYDQSYYMLHHKL